MWIIVHPQITLVVPKYVYAPQSYLAYTYGLYRGNSNVRCRGRHGYLLLARRYIWTKRTDWRTFVTRCIL